MGVNSTEMEVFIELRVWYNKVYDERYKKYGLFSKRREEGLNEGRSIFWDWL